MILNRKKKTLKKMSAPNAPNAITASGSIIVFPFRMGLLSEWDWFVVDFLMMQFTKNGDVVSFIVPRITIFMMPLEIFCISAGFAFFCFVPTAGTIPSRVFRYAVTFPIRIVSTKSKFGHCINPCLDSFQITANVSLLVVHCWASRLVVRRYLTLTYGLVSQFLCIGITADYHRIARDIG